MGVPWLEFPVRALVWCPRSWCRHGQENDNKGEMASGNARPAAKQNMGDEAMKTHGLKSGLNAYMIVVTLCPRFVPLSYSHAAISCTRSMPSGTHLSQLTKALLKLVSGLWTRVGISIGGGGCCAGAGVH